jgi:hypothetical protein
VSLNNAKFSFVLTLSFMTGLVACQRQNRELNVEPKKGSTGTTGGGNKETSGGDSTGWIPKDPDADSKKEEGMPPADSGEKEKKLDVKPKIPDTTPEKTPDKKPDTAPDSGSNPPPEVNPDSTKPETDPKAAPDVDKDAEKESRPDTDSKRKDSGLAVKLDKSGKIILVWPGSIASKISNIEVKVSGTVSPHINKDAAPKSGSDEKDKTKANTGILGVPKFTVDLTYKRGDKSCKGQATFALNAAVATPVMEDCL